MEYQNIYLEGMASKIINYLFVLDTVFEKKEKKRLVNYEEAMSKFKEMATILKTICKFGCDLAVGRVLLACVMFRLLY